MATLFKPLDVQVDGNGLSMAGAKIYFYTTGTSTPRDTYSQSDLDPSHVNPNPVLADSNGLWPAIYLDTTDYKAILKTADDVTVKTLDPLLVNPASVSLSADLDSQFGSTTGSLLQRGASVWQAVTVKAVLDGKFGTTQNKYIRRGASDWEAAAPIIDKQTNALSGDVTLNNTGTFFTGPTLSLTPGTWFVSGGVTLVDTAGGASFLVKLWDGATVIDSRNVADGAGNVALTTFLCGYIVVASTVDVKISVKDGSSTSGKILYNATGEGKDSSITALRIE